MMTMQTTRSPCFTESGAESGAFQVLTNLVLVVLQAVSPTNARLVRTVQARDGVGVMAGPYQEAGRARTPSSVICAAAAFTSSAKKRRADPGRWSRCPLSREACPGGACRPAAGCEPPSWSPCARGWSATAGRGCT